MQRSLHKLPAQNSSTMIEIKFSIRNAVDAKTGRVSVRVRWNKRTNEVCFSSGVYVDQTKWDFIQQKAVKNSVHKVRSMEFTASEINSCLAEFHEAIEECFARFSLQNSIPTAKELKEMVNAELGRDKSEDAIKIYKHASMEDLFKLFIKEEGRNRNWTKQGQYKYEQAFTHFMAANEGITVDDIKLDTMYTLRDWYVNNGYKNRTAVKVVRLTKCFLKWINNQEGYTIPANVLSFKMNLKVIKRTVTFLKYKELMDYYRFEFTKENDPDGKLALARDLFCFMSFTSLRYSDLYSLRPVNIVNGKRIDLVTQKTDEHISIPLIEPAIAIIAKHQAQTRRPGFIFYVPSNQKLNEYLKNSACVAGLNREILVEYYQGNERKQKVKPFYETIGCHDARRTFVCCSLAMGMTPQVVMSCTGHADYKTLKPYIETATDTQSLEMDKWHVTHYKTRYLELFEQIPSNKREELLRFIETKLNEYHGGAH